MRGSPFSTALDAQNRSLNSMKGPRMKMLTTLEKTTSEECLPPTQEVCGNALFLDNGVRSQVLFTPSLMKRSISYRMTLQSNTCGNCGAPAFVLHSWRDTTTDSQDTVAMASFTRTMTPMC